MIKTKLWMWIILGILLTVGILGIGFEARYWKRIYPGTMVLDIEIGGKTKSEAVSKLREKVETLKEIKLAWGTSNWTMNFSDIGVSYNIEETVIKAFKIGRSGKLSSDLVTKATNVNSGTRVDLDFVIDENSLMGAIASISAEINIPAQEPEVTYDKNTERVDVTSGENGQEVDTRELVQEIKTKISTVSNQIVSVPVKALQPKLGSSQLEFARERAQKLVGKKLRVNFSDGEQKWEVDSFQLMTWLDPSAGSGQTGWKAEQISGWVAQLAETIDRPAQNASFQFVSPGRVQEFKPAKEGWKINQEEMSKNILEALAKLDLGKEAEDVDLITEKSQPQVKNADVNNLGIKELLGKGESWFSGSIDNRIFNLEKATGVLNGILVAPGETFSFNQALGEVSAKTGYKQAYVISQGKTVLGDGGGVCQTSTTMFRAVLAAGLPILERTAHAYRVSYYEEKYQPGFDATVFQPNPDFKFKNDTPGYILIQTSVDPVAKKLVYDIYGTSDGRKAEISKARTWDVSAPPPDLYQDDPTLPVGVVRQTEHAAWGAKIAFDWKVTRGEEILQQRTFFSSYAPWQAVYLRGTKI